MDPRGNPPPMLYAAVVTLSHLPTIWWLYAQSHVGVGMLWRGAVEGETGYQGVKEGAESPSKHCRTCPLGSGEVGKGVG